MVDQLGDHGAACARSGLLARRALILERAWVRMVRVAREAVAAEGRVVSPNSGWREPPRQEVRQMTGAGSTSSFMPRLGEALCCDVTLALPLHADGRPQPASLDRDTAAQTTTLPGTCHPQRLVVLAAEVGGRWG